MPGIIGPGGTPGSATAAAAKDQSKYATFIKKVHDATGIDVSVLTAWATIENGPASNPLNIMIPSSSPQRPATVANYLTQNGAADATIKLLRTGTYAPILKAASQGDVYGQLHAIWTSPWDAGHYSGDSSTPGASILGVYTGLYGAAPGKGIPGAVAGVVSALDPTTYIGQAENWLSSAALRALLYVTFTGGAFVLINLALRRATSAAPGPAGYAKKTLAGRAVKAGEGIPF